MADHRGEQNEPSVFSEQAHVLRHLSHEAPSCSCFVGGLIAAPIASAQSATEEDEILSEGAAARHCRRLHSGGHLLWTAVPSTHESG